MKKQRTGVSSSPKTKDVALSRVFQAYGYQALFDVITGLTTYPRAIQGLSRLRMLYDNPKRASVERQFKRYRLYKGTDFSWLEKVTENE